MLRKIFISADGRLRSGWAIALFLLALSILGQLPMKSFGKRFGIDTSTDAAFDDPRVFVLTAFGLLVIMAATWIGCRAVKQPLSAAGFADSSPLLMLALGSAIGAAFVTTICVAPFLLGKSVIQGPTDGALSLLGTGLAQLVALGPQSAAEEVALRGFAFQQLARGTNQVVAVLVTGSVFGLGHLANPNSSAVAAMNIAMIGIWFGLLVVRSGSLWLAIGLHIAWNWFEGFFWGHPVSGTRTGGMLFHRVGHDSGFWTGGLFGPEASTFTALILVVVVGLTFIAPARRAVVSLRLREGSITKNHN